MGFILVLTLLIGFLIVYHHAVYPILLKLLAAKHTNDDDITQPLSDENCPTIHLILPAYNEADVVADKLHNVAKLNYPADKLKITLVGDGCKDDTMDIARLTLVELGQCPFDIEIDEHIENRGKIGVLNQSIGDSTADIIALSDISALINEQAMMIAAKRFMDEKVGVVNSCYQFANYSSEGEKAYWAYQSRVKKMETDTGSVIGAHGALYFFRRHLFTPLPKDTINDDFILPMRIVEQGYKAVHEQRIVALELECVQIDANNHRRMRIAAGNLQQAIRLRGLLKPSFKGVAFNFLSGKVLRVCMPFFLLAFYLLSFVLLPYYAFFAFLAIGQTIFYALALYLHYTRQESRQEPNQDSNIGSQVDLAQREADSKLSKLLAVIYYFASGYWFSFVGMTQYLAKSKTFKV